MNKKTVVIGLILTLSIGTAACAKESQRTEDNLKLSNKQDTNKQDTKKNDNDEKNDNINLNVEKVGPLLSVGDSVIEIFGGNEDAAKLYAKTIKEYGDTLIDRNVYNIIIPTHAEFLLPKKYEDMSKPQKPTIDLIAKTMGDSVISVDAYSTLKSHKDEYTYFRSDHHWTSLGAYYAYEAYAKEAGFKPVELNDYSSQKIEEFLGTFYGSTKEQKLKDNPDYVEYYSVGENYKATMYKDNSLSNPVETTLYADYAKGGNAYGVFLHGDNPLMKVENPDSTEGKKAVLIKESYGNAFAPFLTPHYSELYIVDLRYFENNLVNFINEHNIDDIIFINNTFAASTPMHIDKLKSMK